MGNKAATGSETARRAPTASVWARLRYRFDAALSRGPAVVIGWLGLITLAVIVLTALVLTILRLKGVNGESDNPLGFAEAFWQSLLRVVDSGSFAGDTSWITRLVTLTVTLIGIFLAGSLIGLIASSVDQQIEELRKGRSAVLESDHTLILGWSVRVPSIVSELVIANESRKRAAIVVLSSEDKSVVEEALRHSVSDFKRTKLVCRSGDPSDPRALELANIAGARSVVIVGGNDAITIKCLLAIRTLGSAGSTVDVVAEMVDADTAASARALFGDRLAVVNSDSVVAELTAQACRQRGLSSVFRELLDFDGDELYFAQFPQLVGRTYAEAVMAFEQCSVMGWLRNRAVELNPPPEAVLEADVQLIALASDDSEFVSTGVMSGVRELTQGEVVAPTGRRRIIVAGWSGLGPRVIAELDEFLGSETTLELMLDPDRVDIGAVRESVAVRNVNVEISELRGGPERVAAQAARRAFNEVIVLGYRDTVSIDDADARTLLTLLAFRQVRQAEDVGPVRMVAELLDQRNAKLATAAGVDDFIVSDQLTSLMLAQLSERLELVQVFDDLFDRNGCTIELRPVSEFGAIGRVTFAEVVLAASRRSQSAIGYRVGATDAVVVNPAKSAVVSLVHGDEIVVLSGAHLPIG